MTIDAAQAVEQVILSLDVACFSLRAGGLEVLLVQRGDEPFAGMWALPGGAVGRQERLDDAAARLLEERTKVSSSYLEQLYTFGDPGRDPRPQRTVTVAYYALLARGEHPVGRGRGVSAVQWFPLARWPALAFDHDRIAAYAHQRLQQKITYAPIAYRVLPQTFTIRDVRLVHEAILGHPLHASNFMRQLLARDELEAVEGSRDRRSRRPAQLFRYIGPPEISGPPPATATAAEATPTALAPVDASASDLTVDAPAYRQ